jgi:hypothetical protein
MITARCLAWLMALGLSLGPAPALLAQEPETLPVIPVDGTEVFCWLLKARSFDPVQSLDDLQTLPPEQTLIIVFGRADVLHQIRPLVGGFRQYQERGGALLFASDYAGSLPEWELLIPPVTVQQRPGVAYRENRDCPRIPHLEPGVPPGFHELAHGLATNRPSFFQFGVDPDLTIQVGGVPPPRPIRSRPLALFNDDCFPRKRTDQEAPRIRERAPAQWRVEPPPYIMYTDDGDTHGRALLIAGHGLFTNAMLLQDDNDNRNFADDCLRWLGQGVRRRLRNHALFIVDGTVINSFDTQLSPPTTALPPVPTPTIQLVNRLLAGMEREGFLFRLLDDVLDVNYAVRISLIVLTGLMLLYGAKRVMEQRYHAEAGALAATGPFAAAPDQAPLMRQRYRSQVVRDGLWEEARAMVRAWFEQAAGIPPAAWDRNPLPELPAVVIAGGWWQRRRLRRAFEQAAEFAGYRIPTRFSLTELVRLTAALHELTDALRASRLQFSDGSPVRNS